jgi:hypothetical protein
MFTTSAQVASGTLAAREFSHRRSAYRPTRQSVKGPRQLFPGRRDRTPARPPTTTPRPAGTCHAAALGLLVSLLALQAGTLAPRQRAKAWGYVGGWAREIVRARHTSEAA